MLKSNKPNNDGIESLTNREIEVGERKVILEIDF